MGPSHNQYVWPFEAVRFWHTIPPLWQVCTPPERRQIQTFPSGVSVLGLAGVQAPADAADIPSTAASAVNDNTSFFFM
jgi:hypothetical protein